MSTYLRVLGTVVLGAGLLASPARPDAAYPAEVIRRPLVLPRGMAEPSFTLWSQSANRYYDDAGRRTALGFVPGDGVTEQGGALGIRYGILEGFEASLSVPLEDRQVSLTPVVTLQDTSTGQTVGVYLPSSYHAVDLGDLSLGADYLAFEVPEPHFWGTVGLGVKLANGSGNPSLKSISMTEGFQGKTNVGTGQADYDPRIKAKILLDPVSLEGGLTYRIRSKRSVSTTVADALGQLTEATADVDPGNVLELRGAAVVEALPHCYPSLGIEYARFYGGSVTFKVPGFPGLTSDVPVGSLTAWSLGWTVATERIDASVEEILPLAGRHVPIAGYESLLSSDTFTIAWPDRSIDGYLGGSMIRGTLRVRF